MRSNWFAIWLTVAGVILVVEPSSAWAEGFPRGSGFYFSLPKMLAVLAYFLGWLFACSWIDTDAQELDLERLTWSGMTAAGGVVGLVLFWLMPTFLIGYVLALTMLVVPIAAYLLGRDAQVDPVQRVLTSKQVKRLLQKIFRVDLGVPDDPPRPVPLRIRFLPLSSETARRPRRIQEARGQRGYRTLELLLSECHRRRGNGISVEVGAAGGMVSYRVDGLPHAAVVLGPGRADGLIRVCLTLARLSWPAVGRTVQADFPCQIEQQRYRVRISFERQELKGQLNLRLYAETQEVRDLATLNLAPLVLQHVQRFFTSQRGLLIICGPPDNGRTHFAYSLLQAAKQRQLEVASVEWPCDVHLDNLRWIPAEVNAKERPAASLRRVLNELSADVAMVGDLDHRDLLAVATQRAAKLDVLLLGVITAEDAVSGLQKLLDLGLAPAGLGRLVTGIFAVRLVRQLCPACKVKYRPNAELLRRANLPADRVQFLYRPPDRPQAHADTIVCSTCQDLGYRGRSLIVELLVPNDELRELVKHRPSISVLREAALRTGMKTLSDEALRLALEGRTSLLEIISYLQ
ncbi:MAG: ATPase, T2SS/T4P/T4SS family [Gemmatales bacterium]|nr:ATPase, T2SS/T4P/T4SS family [Gemmatales bacterium]MDW8221947.1 ATPase, T2SS/T4P/T4SS family [Gemmatales bacterium]